MAVSVAPNLRMQSASLQKQISFVNPETTVIILANTFCRPLIKLNAPVYRSVFFHSYRFLFQFVNRKDGL